MAESVNCYKLEGTYRLYNDLEEVCYKGSHIWMLVFVSAPGLIFWAFGIPFYALFELYKFNSGVEDSKINSNPSVHTFKQVGGPFRKSKSFISYQSKNFQTLGPKQTPIFN